GISQNLPLSTYTPPQDYRFFTFANGEIFIQFDYGKYWYFYDKNWRFCDFTYKIPLLNDAITKPRNFALMKAVARSLARNFTRVDLYEVDGKLFVGELTWTPNGGTIKWNPKSWDKKLGEFWQ
ncbi:ATP-grasp fold amidoligase family protein, partial [Helicobacter sp. 23-1045]